MIKVIPFLTVIARSFVLLTSPAALKPSLAQDHPQMHHEQPASPDHSQMHHEQPAQDHSQMHHDMPVKKQSKAKRKRPVRHTDSMSHENMPGMDHGAAHSGHEMRGFLGPYGIGREGSG